MTNTEAKYTISISMSGKRSRRMVSQTISFKAALPPRLDA